NARARLRLPVAEAGTGVLDHHRVAARRVGEDVARGQEHALEEVGLRRLRVESARARDEARGLVPLLRGQRLEARAEARRLERGLHASVELPPLVDEERLQLRLARRRRGRGLLE